MDNTTAARGILRAIQTGGDMPPVGPADLGPDWATVGPIIEARARGGPDAGARALESLLRPDSPGPDRARLLWLLGSDDGAPAAVDLSDGAEVPDLPDYARIDPGEGSGAGSLLDEYTAYAGQVSPMTPAIFHESGALWLGAVAIARRLCVRLPWDDVYPNLFISWVADTSVYRKSTGLNIVRNLAGVCFPHLMTPQDTTPESLLSDLAGTKPQNYDSMADGERLRWEAGRNYAAQKGLVLDEFSGLLASKNKDYSGGLAENLLRLFDCYDRFTRSTRGAGWITITNSYLSMLGASTPAAMAEHIQNDALWGVGWWPRFAILTPDAGPVWIETADHTERPARLVNEFSRLRERLPRPTWPEFPAALSIVMETGVMDGINRYNKALSFDLARGDLIDNKLIGLYARLPAQLVKVASILAAFDWPDGAAVPVIGRPHLARALGIVERWRYSAHRALAWSQESDFHKLRARLRRLLSKADGAGGATMRDLCKGLKDRRPGEIETCLQELVTAGEVEQMAAGTGAKGGRPTMRYRLVRG